VLITFLAGISSFLTKQAKHGGNGVKEEWGWGMKTDFVVRRLAISQNTGKGIVT
jgi:hypothetical protein